MASDKDIKNTARFWLVRRQSGEMTADEQAELARWLSAAPQHREEFERVSSLWDRLEEFRDRPFPARDAARKYRPRRQVFFSLPSVQLAAAMTVVLALTLVFSANSYWGTSDEVFRTAKGERLSLSLDDGSVIEMNTDTEVRVAFDRKSRTIHLIQGEAFFTVADAHARPFVVIAGQGRILDLSTSFNVYRQSDRVEVAVTDGAVSVTTNRAGPIILEPGNMLSYAAASGDYLALDRQYPEVTVAWLEGRIRFSQTPLKDVMAQLSRYHPITYVINDPAVADMKVSGTFRSDDLPLFITTLEAAFPVQATLDGRFIRLDPAAR